MFGCALRDIAGCARGCSENHHLDDGKPLAITLSVHLIRLRQEYPSAWAIMSTNMAEAITTCEGQALSSEQPPGRLVSGAVFANVEPGEIGSLRPPPAERG